MDGKRRGVSPVVGVALMIVVVLLLSATIAAGVFDFGQGLAEREREYDRAASTVAGNPWSGDQGDLVRLSNAGAGATDVRYRVNFTIQPGSNTIGNSLNSVYLEVTTGSPDVFSATAQSDLDRVVVDENSDGTVDQEITHDVNGWQVKNGGTALKIGFSGSAYTNPSEGDSIVVVSEGAENPDSPGTYDLRAETSGDGNWHDGTISITE